MDRIAAMILLLGAFVSMTLFLLALFSVAPIFCSCLCALLYILYYFLANEGTTIHHAQEFENRFWTVFFVLLTMAGIYVKDSPFSVYFESRHSGWGFFVMFIVGYGVHTWDRMVHRKHLTSHVGGLRRGASAAQSLLHLNAHIANAVVSPHAGAKAHLTLEEQLQRISTCMDNIDQLLVPSTINNFINQQFIMRNEREIISIFEDAQPKTLNWLISHVKLALVFYKIKDHRNFRGQHRTELIELLAVDRVSSLTIYSRVLLLRALQLMKLPANARAEHWVRNIILSTHQDDLSKLKTMTDTKGDYFCMNKLIYSDVRSDTVRQDILSHFRKEAAVQQAHMDMGTRKARLRMEQGWRKILSDVDDTLTSSGGSYPAGIDKRYSKKVVYPGVIGLYRELDLGIRGPEEFPSDEVGNLVFLSARPHLYKDFSEKHNFSKFEKLRERQGSRLHTIPSLLAGDLSSGREFMMTNDFEPLAKKKFQNFKQFVSIYPEYRHVFICDNGQGDVRAGELMYDQYPRHLEFLFVHLVQDIQKTYGFEPERWRRKGLLKRTCFFKCYPDAALYAATIKPPLIRISGLRRVCQDAAADFEMILPSQWSSSSQKRDRRSELNQSLWRCNQFLESKGEEIIPLIESPRQWEDGERVRTIYGIGVIKGFDPIADLYDVEIDWRPLDEQIRDFEKQEATKKDTEKRGILSLSSNQAALQTVVEEDESNYLSPATSFSKHSSKQSFIGNDRDTSSTLPRTSSGNELSFGASGFDRRHGVGSPEPTLDETTASDETSPVNKKGGDGDTAVPPSITTKEVGAKRKLSFGQGIVVAKIQGKHVTKFTPPTLPKLQSDEKEKNRSKTFSFWATDSVKSAVDNVEASKSKQLLLSPGERVTTPYGVGVVVEHRKKTNIIVVDMTGPWTARAYLKESIVKREGAGLIGTLLRSFTGVAATSPKRGDSSPRSKAERNHPFAAGAKVVSPFGEGKVIRPLSLQIPSSSALSSCASKEKVDTIAVSLTEWTLRDGSHPTLYCTMNTAKEWKNKTEGKDTHSHRRESSLFSVIGSMVSGTVASLQKIRVPKEIEAPTIKVEALFERYYKDGAAVATAYGDGVVKEFRASDGFYCVSLLLKSGKVFATAYLQEDSMSYRLARGCQEGYPVLTKYGLSGVLQSVNPTTGVHNVIIPSCGAMCYLQPDQVVRQLKAAVGEDVSTKFGDGKVMKYRLSDDKYEIKLTWGGATLYAEAKTFDRIDDRMEYKGGFRMGWILNFFYSREENKEDGAPRSRSNSFSMLSQSNVSTRSLR
ncbi:hypothetical protein ACHAWT_011044 [Skeletonema menzelii]